MYKAEGTTSGSVDRSFVKGKKLSSSMTATGSWSKEVINSSPDEVGVRVGVQSLAKVKDVVGATQAFPCA